ncbi:coproporphyrinogen dehydrogenase HemZ [Megasphaera vaginalis (ex Srinivasan et al. 2021)]|uniref:Coproporphyrinogen dehydrogenase HemZ n=1 Tax=Megasphaera vaginalis (ex Srinivasan et al. 2021) TaxID=1111454 RepID=U7UCC1_9FIRM|nr:coproporphyrinogen dehydrogenase HemZ [Megasphaera vaginalis (ex Srinivasan et al. 2021)]ERT57082.1 coproporphyrinogen dehydrogenase HemZ [Megasphaera vaginalis (ex Srinivasan et al. 2021)]
MPDRRESYTYRGPETYHSHVGQIMACLGYSGGHEPRTVGAQVVIEESGGNCRLCCRFLQAGAVAERQALLTARRERQEMKDYLLQWHRDIYHLPPSPWGSLIGVRPTKLVHHILDSGVSPQAAVGRLQETYGVAEKTASELVKMALLQRPYVTNRQRRAAVYVSIPYCSSHCLYCSFPSRLIGGEEPSHLAGFLARLEADGAAAAALCREFALTVDAVYVGGGTPTCLPLPLLERLLRILQPLVTAATEWTVEAGRPDTATAEKLQLLKRYGVNRISVNPQTMQQPLLDLLGRRHRIEDIYTMMALCKKLAFPVINMDFIAGLPRQTPENMQENMEIVCQLGPENVTIHTLALKKGAPLFHHDLRRAIGTAEAVTAMVDYCREKLQRAGYVPYYLYRQKYMAAGLANIGYALPGAIGRYNIEMMEERQTVIGIGPGSASKFISPTSNRMEKLYMPKDITRYGQILAAQLEERRRLCTVVYGGEDR